MEVPLLHIMDDDEIEEFWQQHQSRKLRAAWGAWDWLALVLDFALVVLGVIAVYQTWFAA